MQTIDINCDVGEGFNNEAELFKHISSCNIACGGHAGNEVSVTEIVKLAKKFNVKVGAHPSYPDKESFGRKSMQLPHAVLQESLEQQINLVVAITKKNNVNFHHIKAHGALYNDLAKDAALANFYVNTIKETAKSCVLYVPFNSVIAKIAIENGLKVFFEAFGDRNYTNTGALVSRQHPNALITNPDKVLEHVLQIIKTNSVTAVDGTTVTLKADTICVHSDTPNAVAIVQFLNHKLQAHKIIIR